MKTIYLILKEDIIFYPPVLSIIKELIELQCKVIHIGVYSDEEQKEYFESLGVSFCPTTKYNGNANLLSKARQQITFRKEVYEYINLYPPKEDDLIWIMQSETLCLLDKLVYKYKTIVHPLEYIDDKISWKYRILNPSFDIFKVMNAAHKVVCCEYNRSQIAKGLFNLKTLPYILPNKPSFDSSFTVLPEDIRKVVEPLKEKLNNKKVILYQGIFLDKERRLDEFCQAIQCMSDEFVFIAMGGGSEMYDTLKSKYESDKILFLPFIRPPYHLAVTQLASIGILSYFPRQGSIASVLNPLYCAPNKIFEYAKFGIPMISNDIPGLHYIYLEYKCGECVKYPMTSYDIKECIEKIFNNYELYSNGALEYYKSVDLKSLIGEIIS